MIAYYQLSSHWFGFLAFCYKLPGCSDFLLVFLQFAIGWFSQPFPLLEILIIWDIAFVSIVFDYYHRLEPVALLCFYAPSPYDKFPFFSPLVHQDSSVPFRKFVDILFNFE